MWESEHVWETRLPAVGAPAFGAVQSYWFAQCATGLRTPVARCLFHAAGPSLLLTVRWPLRQRCSRKESDTRFSRSATSV